MSENSNSKQLTILTVAAVVMSVASLITAATALYTLKYGNEREEARISRLAAVMEENAARNASPRSTSARTSKTKATTTSSQPTSSSAASTSSQASGQAVAGSGSRTGGGTPTDSSAAAGGASGANAGGGAAQAQGQTGNTPQTTNVPAPNSDQLLDAVIAATDPNSSAETRNGWAVDGSAAGNTLSEVAKIRSSSAPPAGQENKGIGPLTVSINDIVQTGDKATGTIKIAFPGNWGSWTYENSGFQYVDGKWKLQKSAVCNLAKAAWTKCY